MNIRNSCVICGSRTIAPLFEFPRYPLAQIESVQPGVSIPYKPLVISGCKKCGQIQQGTPLTDDDIFHLYNNKYEFGIHPSSVSIITEDDSLLQTVFRYLQCRKDHCLVLEIGCGNVKRLDILRMRNIQVAGIDPGLPSERENETLIKAPFGSDCFTETFDLIFHNHVFEHILDPIRFLNDVHQLLVEDGIHIIKIPNEEPFFHLGHIGRFIHDHTLYFSPSQLEALFESAGFRVLEIRLLHGEILMVSKKSCQSIFKRAKSGVDNSLAYFEYYKRLISDIQTGLSGLRRFLKGKRLGLYGASHLCYFFVDGITAKENQIRIIIDRDKKGFYLSGLSAKIVDDLDHMDALDVIVITAQNAQEEILERILGHRKRPGHVLTLFPRPHLHVC